MSWGNDRMKLNFFGGCCKLLFEIAFSEVGVIDVNFWGKVALWFGRIVGFEDNDFDIVVAVHVTSLLVLLM